jgi:hypothetical protein
MSKFINIINKKNSLIICLKLLNRVRSSLKRKKDLKSICLNKKCRYHNKPKEKHLIHNKIILYKKQNNLKIKRQTQIKSKV